MAFDSRSNLPNGCPNNPASRGHSSLPQVAAKLWPHILNEPYGSCFEQHKDSDFPIALKGLSQVSFETWLYAAVRVQPIAALQKFATCGNYILSQVYGRFWLQTA